MERHEFEKLRETVYTDTLSNGLKIRVAEKKGFSRIYAFFATNYGSIDTAFTLNGKRYETPPGVAHYLEHKMFDTKSGNAMEKFTETGASPNAFTGYQITAYYFSCTSDFEKNLETLLSFVSEGYFTEESVEKERGIIAQEIKMYEDSPGSRLSENLFRAMYHNHPVRVPIAGTVESIQKIDPDILYACHRAFYDPSNMVLSVVGDVSPERVHEIAEAVLPKQSIGTATRDYGAPEPRLPRMPRISEKMEVSMPMFAIGFKGPELLPGQARFRMEIIGELAAEVLCGESSSLYQQLYESGLIDSGFSVDYGFIKGLPSMMMSGDSEAPEKVLDEILNEARRISDEGVDAELFRRLKKSDLGRRIRGLDSFEGLCYRMAGAEFDGYDYFSFADLYESIDTEDIRRLIAEQIIPELAALSVIYPKERTEMEDSNVL